MRSWNARLGWLMIGSALELVLSCQLDPTSVGDLPDTTGDPDAGSATAGSDSGAGSSGDADSEGGSGCVEPLPAFPGAEGFGSTTAGGRRGRVLLVTNLADDGPGSFRAALAESGPRMVVFRTGGTIVLRAGLYVTEPYVTVLGQTAPGDGIELRADPDAFTESALRVSTHDVVIRHIRSRPGPSTEPSCCRQALSIGGGAHDVVIDHVSLGWSTDELLSSWYDARDVTIQWSVFAHALVDANHIDGPNGRAIALGADIRNHSFHHNLIAHNILSNPELASTWDTTFDLVNNVIYDYGQIGAQFSGPIRGNLIGNTFLPGPSSVLTRRGATVYDTAQVWVADNRSPTRPGDATDEWEVLGDGSALDAIAPAEHRAGARFDAPPVTTEPVDAARQTVLASAGATRPARDAVDIAVVDEARTGGGGLIDTVDGAGGWLVRDPGTPPVDRDDDGIPDGWERDHGLDPDDPTDSSAVDPQSCYTWIEVYAAELAG